MDEHAPGPDSPTPRDAPVAARPVMHAPDDDAADAARPVRHEGDDDAAVAARPVLRTDDDAAVDALAMRLLNDVVSAGPGLVRLATGMGWRMSAWAWRSSLAATQRVLRAAVEGESVGALTAEAIDAARFQAREILGLEMEDRAEPTPSRGEVTDRSDSEEQLRRRGQQLLAVSADVHHEEPSHPAYDRILDDLAPDEARILRLLCDEGPQPSVDVRTAGTPMTSIGSTMVAPGLSMIGAHAGVRYLDRVPAYLNNLFRLGLLWFSREPVEDLVRYQVLEAQPDVAEALREAGRGKTVRRSIHLTPFGQDFCHVALGGPPPNRLAETNALDVSHEPPPH